MGRRLEQDEDWRRLAKPQLATAMISLNALEASSRFCLNLRFDVEFGQVAMAGDCLSPIIATVTDHIASFRSEFSRQSSSPLRWMCAERDFTSSSESICIVCAYIDQIFSEVKLKHKLCCECLHVYHETVKEISYSQQVQPSFSFLSNFFFHFSFTYIFLYHRNEKKSSLACCFSFCLLFLLLALRNIHKISQQV